jgi:DNA-binding MarR family transcriptional regulator
VSPLLASELAARVGALQRALRRRTRTVLGQPWLTPSEGELLGLVASRPDVRVGDVAAGLRLASNTVSTLVRRLVEQGLVATQRDEHDRRAVRLRATATGQRRVRRWRAERTRLLGDVLDGLSESERHLLASALPILTALADALEEDESP